MFGNIKTNKLLLIGVILIGVAFVGFFLLRNSSNFSSNNESITPTTAVEEAAVGLGVDPLNTTYLIEEEQVALTDGTHEKQIPDSSTIIITRNFNEPIYGDLNGIPNEENEDATFLIVQEPGGSGTFYYVVASISEEEGYLGTNGIFIGDRIAPQTQEILEDGTIVVNYADREEGVAMSEAPSVGMSKYFKLEGNKLVEVPQPTISE